MKIGSLCTGSGTLALELSARYGAKVEWMSEIDKHASKVAAARLPGVPNLGDLIQLDAAGWDVPAVDILAAGYPCQPFSNAGKHRGVNDDRHLWPYIERAVRAIRPRLCVFENVQGHLRLGGTTVVGSLASMGYGVNWGLVRASDAGAPHRRARLFIVAHAADACGE